MRAAPQIPVKEVTGKPGVKGKPPELRFSEVLSQASCQKLKRHECLLGVKTLEQKEFGAVFCV